MPKEKILIVDDEQDIVELVRYNLSREGYQTITSLSGEDAISKARSKLPELIILDLMLPGLDGLEVCKMLRADNKTARIPIIMLTAKSEESDIVTGLEVGADDYVVKPFSPRVLVSRVKTILRRRTSAVTEDQTVIKLNDIVIDPMRHEVSVKGRQIDLTFTEFRILQTLAGRPGVVFSRYQIVDAIRGSDYPVTDRSVDVQIVSLRKKLGSAGRHIETVRSVGYKFRD